MTVSFSFALSVSSEVLTAFLRNFCLSHSYKSTRGNPHCHRGASLLQNCQDSAISRKLALAIGKRSHEGSPPADVDWEQFHFGPGLQMTKSLSLRKLLHEFQHTLEITPDELGCKGLTYHSIPTDSSDPVHQHPRRVAPAECQIISFQVGEMFSKYIVSPSHST